MTMEHNTVGRETIYRLDVKRRKSSDQRAHGGGIAVDAV